MQIRERVFDTETVLRAIPARYKSAQTTEFQDPVDAQADYYKILPDLDGKSRALCQIDWCEGTTWPDAIAQFEVPQEHWVTTPHPMASQDMGHAR